MIVKIITDKKIGKRWEIIKHEEDNYSVNYYEYFKNTGWKLYIMPKEHYSKEAIEFEFNTKVA